MEEVRITREGDAAVIEYADESVATTNFGLGAAKLAMHGYRRRGSGVRDPKAVGRPRRR